MVGFNFKVPNIESAEYEKMLKTEIEGYNSNKKIFTDDYAPVEKFCI